MKKLWVLLMLASAMGSAYGQTATNFNCNDCAGVSHDLFAELNSGKVIVLDWVMPCATCVGPSLTTYNVVQSYQSSHPGRVFFYMVDDYANTICTSIDGWANSINIPQNAFSRRFSNAAINMLDYGSTGMPKIVVLGGVDHTVFYSANNTVNVTALQNAINSALSSTGIPEQTGLFSSLVMFPNPVDKTAEIKFNLGTPGNVTIEMFNLQGKKMKDLFSGEMKTGENKVEVNTANIASGTYLIKLTSDGKHRFMNMVVAH